MHNKNQLYYSTHGLQLAYHGKVGFEDMNCSACPISQVSVSELLFLAQWFKLSKKKNLPDSDYATEFIKKYSRFLTFPA